MTGYASVFDNSMAANTSSPADGAGVYVKDTNSSFTMSGSASVYKNSTGYGYGGGVYVEGSFKMSASASVYENNCSNNGQGGGVYVKDTSFTMSASASVYENSALIGGGISVKNGTLEMADYSTVSGNKLYSNPGAKGGGVYLYGGTFNMTGNAMVARNIGVNSSYPVWGGGVYLEGGAVTMSGYSSVSGNTATGTEARGGGIFIRFAGTLTMKGNASVSGNTATATKSGGNYAYGGGIYLDGTLANPAPNINAHLYENSSISGNSAVRTTPGTAKGGGVAILGTTGIDLRLYSGVVYGYNASGGGPNDTLKNTVVIEGNSKDDCGSAIYSEMASVQYQDTTIIRYP
jgi:putative cofactor-binding repeat protein